MRYKLVDTLRGAACLGMFVYHVEAIRMYVFQAPSLWINDYLGYVLGYSVRFSFLLLVGLSTYFLYERSHSFLSFVRNQSKRFAMVGGAALVVSLVSYLVMPDYTIYLGVLHLIAISILMMMFLPKAGQLLNVVIGLVLVGIGFGLESVVEGWVGVLLGFPELGFRSFDYFPIVPWLGVVMIGYGVGRWFVKLPQKVLDFQIGILDYIGKRALIFYLIHLPLIYLFWSVVYFL